MKKLSIKNNTLIQSVNFLHFLNKKGDLVKANIIDYHLEGKMQLSFKRKEIDISQNLKHKILTQEETPKYSFRKYSFGLASALIGLTAFSGGAKRHYCQG